jgi:hypothetical protein
MAFSLEASLLGQSSRAVQPESKTIADSERSLVGEQVVSSQDDETPRGLHVPTAVHDSERRSDDRRVKGGDVDRLRAAPTEVSPVTRFGDIGDPMVRVLYWLRRSVFVIAKLAYRAPWSTLAEVAGPEGVDGIAAILEEAFQTIGGGAGTATG